jgi:5-formyltetrahydrofolate cyclo-ligase
MQAAKDELRRTMRDRRLTLSRDEVISAGRQAAAQFETVPGVREATLFAVYSPIRGEIDTAPLIARLRARGARVAYPRVDRGAGLRFHAIDDDAALQPGTMGILEPSEYAPSVEPADVQVFVVPGLAFDLDGGRLGWGRGYYDTTLAAAPRALRVGYAHEFQLVPAVPSAHADQRMDWIVTSSRAIDIRRDR